MSPRTDHTGLSRPDFLVDPTSAERIQGRQIDWANVNVSFADANGFKAIPHGHPMAPAADARRMVPATNAAANEADAYGLLEGPAQENNDSLTGYGVVVGAVVWEELVPGITATIKTALGTRFWFETYSDTRDVSES